VCASCSGELFTVPTPAAPCRPRARRRLLPDAPPQGRQLLALPLRRHGAPPIRHPLSAPPAHDSLLREPALSHFLPLHPPTWFAPHPAPSSPPAPAHDSLLVREPALPLFLPLPRGDGAPPIPHSLTAASMRLFTALPPRPAAQMHEAAQAAAKRHCRRPRSDGRPRGRCWTRGAATPPAIYKIRIQNRT
jgi:hypothetical protein